MYVYLLLDTTETRTYVGATVNLSRRLQQHNGEKTGGAKSTKGRQWNRICYIYGCPDWSATLQCEWKWKHLTKTSRGATPLHRRIKALITLLELERSTQKAIPFSDWLHTPSIQWENDTAKQMYDTIKNEK